MDDVNRLLTAREAADVLQLNITTVYELLNKGGIPGRKFGGSWRINLKDLLNTRQGRARGAVSAETA